MATFARKTFDSSAYLKQRATYGPSVYKAVFDYFKYHNPNINNTKTTAIDLGCGPGATTIPLIDHFDTAIGLDNSLNMVDTAIENFGSDQLKFQQGSDKSLASTFPSSSIDVITASQAAHWFSYPDFFNQAYQVLKLNGTIALWGYVDPEIKHHPKASNIHMKYLYDKNYMGQYWEPGRFILRQLYKDIHVPTELFTDIKWYRHSAQDRCTDTPFTLNRKLTVSKFKELLQTSSNYHAWKEAHPNETDMCESCIEEMKHVENWTDDTEIELEYSTVLLLATKC